MLLMDNNNNNSHSNSNNNNNNSYNNSDYCTQNENVFHAHKRYYVAIITRWLADDARQEKEEEKAIHTKRIMSEGVLKSSFNCLTLT